MPLKSQWDQWLQSQREFRWVPLIIFPSMPFLLLTLISNHISVFICIQCGKGPWKLLRQFNIQPPTQEVKLILSGQNPNLWGRNVLVQPETCAHYDQLDVDWDIFLSSDFVSLQLNWELGASSQLYVHQCPCKNCVGRRLGVPRKKEYVLGKLIDVHLKQERWKA